MKRKIRLRNRNSSWKGMMISRNTLKWLRPERRVFGQLKRGLRRRKQVHARVVIWVMRLGVIVALILVSLLSKASAFREHDADS